MPAGSTVQQLRHAVDGAVRRRSPASGRLYPGALVQLEGAAGAEMLTVVTASATARVTLSAAPANDYVEGEASAVVEARPHRALPPGRRRRGDRADRGLRLTDDAHPDSFVAQGQRRGRGWSRVTARRRLRRHGPPGLPGGLHRAPGRALGGGDDALGEPRRRRLRRREPRPRASAPGIQALEDIDQVAICLVPGMWSVDVRTALIVHCETLADRFAILDPPPGLGVQEVEAFRSPIDTKYAALYYPWVDDPRPAAGRRRRCRRRRRASSPASTPAPTSPAACTRRRPTR